MELSTSEFLAAFLTAVALFYPESIDLSYKPIDRLESELYDSYDFIIIGAGSAGCVLANRLSENPYWTVLLIEDGGQEDAVSEAPLLDDYLFDTDLMWHFNTVKQRTCLDLDGVCPFVSGHVMGGSTTISDMMYVRGNAEDYNYWESLGNPGWGYDDVLPYFIRSENINIPELVESPYHGVEGPMTIEYSLFDDPLIDAFLNGGNEIGIPTRDYNGINQNGIGRVQSTIKGASKQSVSRAYLNQIRDRSNLHIVMNARATRVLLDSESGIAEGVEFVRDGETYIISVNGEVILSGGGINTPHLLMLSGIGPREVLEPLDIPVIADLPVGLNFQDHPKSYFHVLLDQNITITSGMYKTLEAINEYAQYKRGPLTLNSFQSTGFFNRERDDTLPPEMQIIFDLSLPIIGSQNLPLICVHGLVLNPESVGRISLNSADPFDPPLIDPNYLEIEEDEILLLTVMEEIINLIQTESMEPYSPRLYTELTPNCAHLLDDSDLEPFLKCHTSHYTSPIFHPCCTARMGPDPESSVVNSDLLVHGFDNLRIVDSSIMPRIVRGSLNSPVIMIGEKASDIIKNSYFKK